MANLTGSERARYVQGMFARIAGRYDLMNRLMTMGQDVRWRREVIQKAQLGAGDRLLDLGAGTGDLAQEALHQHPGSRIVAADFTFEMMQAGKRRGRQLNWSGADALRLPYRDAAFDALISGFLLRNVSDLPQALVEQYRVLRPGGRVVCLDTTRPLRNWLSPFISFHMHTIIPTLGKLITGQSDAYAYLPDSTENFLAAEDLKAHLVSAGFKQVGFKRLMLGTIAIHWGVK